MTDIFHIAMVAMQDANFRMNAVSQNAASASLPGYRRHVVAGNSFAQVLNNARLADSQEVDVHAGALMTTNRPLDVAMESDDLYFGLTDGEQTWLTRSGAFRLNEEGVLVGERGLRVVGTSGDIRLPGSDVTVEDDGRITQQGIVLGTLQTFRPADRAALRAAQGSLLTAASGEEPTVAGVGRVRGGALEASNTDVTNEMIGLMTIARQFESLSRVVQGYDGVLGRAIEKLGEV